MPPTTTSGVPSIEATFDPGGNGLRSPPGGPAKRRAVLASGNVGV